MKLSLTFIIAAICGATIHSHAEDDVLKRCYAQQVAPTNNASASFSYYSKQHLTYHSRRPWMTMAHTTKGVAWCNGERFAQKDSLKSGDKYRIMTVQLDKDALLEQPYWNEEIEKTTKSQLQGAKLGTAIYNPAMMIAYFYSQHPEADNSDGTNAVYTLPWQKGNVQLHINKKAGVADKIVYTYPHGIYGDVTETYHYNNYAAYKQYRHPQQVIHSKIQGISDTIDVHMIGLSSPIPKLLEKPVGYAIEEDKPETYELVRHKLKDKIYLLELKQASSISVLAEFKDYFVVISSPLNSKNGELILAEAKKINPKKEVKYFAYGHHHPWYLGGVRPFIHNGTTVLTQASNMPYINFIAGTKHTIEPDELQKEYKQVHTQAIDKVYTITDGKMELQIHHIGYEGSKHTDDNTIFYFPKQKILIEDDLLRVTDAQKTTGSDREKSLLNAIKNLHLDVDTVVQTWPWGKDYDVKTIFPFSDVQ